MRKIYFLFLLVVLQVNSQIVNIPDANFKAKLLQADVTNYIAKNLSGNYFKIDQNNNQQIELNEASNVLYIDVLRSAFDYNYISSLVGLGSFVNLEFFRCSGHQVSSLNIIGLSNLKELYCSENMLTNVDLSYFPNIEIVDCSFNQITNLNTNAPSLKSLGCIYNQLSSLNLNTLPNLEVLECSWNPLLNTIDLSNNSLLKTLGCGFNNIENLNVSNLFFLETLYAPNNLLTQIDLSGLVWLRTIFCNNNQITSINLNDVCKGYQSNTFLYSIDLRYNNLNNIYCKNGLYDNFGMITDGNDNIGYVCCDEFEFDVVSSYFNGVACNVNSYCSFTPGGNYYTIQGSQKFDSNVNGCDSNDVLFPNLNFNITDGFSSGNIIANTSGDYSIFVGQGTHTITPILENPTYFNVAPSSLQVTLPNASNPIIQNFCITPNGVYNDLEVVIIPLLPARPGFDATYKILYKNKGNTTLSGSVVLDFEDNKMDFVSSTPSYTTISTGELIYNYSDLAPFETREIIITMNINSPTETPAVNIGDQLNFIVIINPLSGDSYILDNRINFKQTVVGSYDPNDKTCIEGDVVGAEVIGNYIHYVIRFENTGTFPAENIVVKDIIDATKFDINTLTPTSSSHPFVTKISNGTIVEFIFENIQLPFDDANNDGYVAFKIKTLPSLSIGDTFSNNANIYFDYNFPIETNTTLTTIQNLNKTDFEFTDYITLYPNPANSKLNFKVKKDIDVSSINIYNSLGQLVLVVTNPNGFIDVSELKTGSYFVKIISNLGLSNCQFLKE
ncbi:DUF7619 domain-containing protein [Flavobacterium koreense]